MPTELHLILNVAVAVIVALVGGLLAHALRQPAIVGYLLAGIAIGPFTPGFIGDREQIAALAEVGVIFLMFALGIEFSLDELARVRGVALGGTTLQVLLTLFAGIGLGSMVGWPVAQGLFFGGVIAISSTMVVLKMLLERGEVGSPHGQVLLGMLIVQDLATVLLIVLLPQLAGGAGIDASALLGLSPALGAFLGGLLLTETEFDHRVVAEVVPMRNLFGTLFFVSVGMLIDPTFVLRALPAVLGLAAFVAVAKIVMTLVAVLPFRLGARTTAFTALGLLQIGEVSYLLAPKSPRLGALSDELNSLILTSSVVTIILTPPAFRLAPAVGRGLDRLPLLGRHLGVPTSAPDDQPRLAGHAVVVGHGRVGGAVASQLQRAGLPVAVVDADLHVVRHLRAAGVPAVYGDAAYPSVLHAAHPERAHLVVVALPDAGTARAAVAEVRRVNRTVPVLARAA